MEPRYLKWRFAVDDEVFQVAFRDGHPDSRHFLTANFDLYLSRIVDEDTIVAVRDVEGNTFIGLVTRSSTIYRNVIKHSAV